MPTPPRIALIHATRVAMGPIEAAMAQGWPEARGLSLLDESLSADSGPGGAAQDELDRRIVALCRHAEGLGVQGILYTCSAFGPGIEQAAAQAAVPVLKPNQAMFEAAMDAGEDIVMLYTFAPALSGMAAEFAAEAVRRGASARLRPVLVPGALAALQAGDQPRHDALIADAAAAAGAADAILLAQFSMACAAPVVQARTAAPVLTSPDAAVAALKSLIVGAAPC